MSFMDRFIDAFDQVPRDEPLGRIQVAPQGEELSEPTIQRLHSDADLTDLDKFFLGKWAKAHGYDPDLLMEEKRLRLIENCEHPNHRPIREHWTVDCRDHDVRVPAGVGDWQRVDETLYWRPVVWECDTRGGGRVAIRGLYGKWTVTTGIGELGDTLATDVSAADAIQTAVKYMDGNSPRLDYEPDQDRLWPPEDLFTADQP